MYKKTPDDRSHRTKDIKYLAMAISLGTGLLALPAHAQGTIEVGGAGTIGDTVLGSGSAVPNDIGANWSTTGNEAGPGQFIETHLVSPDITVPSTGTVTLTFGHRYRFENGWDGGAIFVSIDGAPATYVPKTALSGVVYNGTVGGAAWAAKEEVFTGQSADYDTPVFVQTVADLGILNAGQTVSVEFRGGWDETQNDPGIDWQIDTVKLTDGASNDFLDVDFPTDGISGFTLASAGGGALTAPWTYPAPTHRFEIDADLLTSDTYSPNGVETVIDLNGANIVVSLLSGTLDAGDTFTLFDTSGSVTLTGSIGSISLPLGIWDTSKLETEGTITIVDTASQVIYEPFSDLDPTLAGNTPGLGLTGTWNGQSFVADGSLTYGALAYEGGRLVTNPNNNYDSCGISPGSTLTDAGLMADGATLWFSVLIKNYTSPLTSDERTYVSFGTGNADGFDRIGGNAGSGFTVAASKVREGGVTAQAWNDGSDGTGGAIRGATVDVTRNETFMAVGKITWGEFGVTDDVFELYLPDEALNLGEPVSIIEADFDQLGTANADNAFDTISIAGGTPLSGVPEVDELRFGGTYADVSPKDTTAPFIVSTDPVDDSPSGNATQQIVTFNAPVLIGSGDIRIVNDTDSVTTTIPVGDPQIVVSGNTLTITPTVQLIGGKAYHIEIDPGVVTNFNAINFAGITSATEWNFIADGTPPTLVSITDNVSPAPLLVNTGLTYTVTFNEPIQSSTLDVTDFENRDNATITVDGVTATGDPAVFEVAVSATGTGNLTLQIAKDAVITDITGNPLDTTSAIPDDTTIAVNNPAVTSASLLADFQATIGSEQHPTYAGEARYFHVSVNPNNPGTGSYAATIVGTNDPAPAFVRNFTAPVLSYKFAGGAGVAGTMNVGMSGGDASLITHTTVDPVYDGFGQQQAKIWDATDPGTDLQTTVADPFAAVGDANSGLFRSLGGAIGTIDISGLTSGSVHIYYGAFNAKPSVRVTMRDTDNVAADIVLNNVHLNDDTANRTEYYLAEIDFVTDGFYDVIEYEWLANGVDYTGNGRGIGTVLTGTGSVVVSSPYENWAATNAPNTGNDPSADEDGDGVSNGLEFVLGGTIATNDLEKLPTTTTDGTAMTFTFVRDQSSIDASTVVTIETSTDLITWDSAPSPYAVPDAATAGPPVAVVDNGNGTDTVTLTVAQAPDTKKFARLKVEIAP